MNILLGAGVYLLDSWRNRLGGTVEDLRSRGQDTYETAADRVSRASEIIRGEDSHVVGTATAALLGLGIGVGLGLLLAPASGEETRSNMANKARDIRAARFSRCCCDRHVRRIKTGRQASDLGLPGFCLSSGPLANLPGLTSKVVVSQAVVINL
jgi:hypothetical protein